MYPRFKPTLIMLDLSIGEGDGIEILRFLSKLHCTCPIIVMSGHDEKVRMTVFRLGADYGLNMATHLQKPLDLEKVIELLEKNKSKGSFINEHTLAKAIKEYELQVYYQPLISFKTHELLAVEALVRWQPIDHSLILPDAFIALAEDKGLIYPLTEFVIDKAFEQSSLWTQNNLPLTVKINLSSKLFNSLTLPDEISVKAKKFGVAHSNICFEITESGAMNQPQIATDILARLRVKGFSLSLDDFGTGYSSLVELHRLPFSEIKIDKSFVLQILEDQECISIVNSIIQLGHSLKMEVVAEGVETKAIWDKLTDMGCDIAQGYYIGHPMSIKDFNDWLLYNIDKNRKLLFLSR